MSKSSRDPKDLNYNQLCNLHAYFARNVPAPLSETAKQILEEIELRLLNLVKGTKPAQQEPKPDLFTRNIPPSNSTINESNPDDLPF